MTEFSHVDGFSGPQSTVVMCRVWSRWLRLATELYIREHSDDEPFPMRPR